MQMMGSCFVTGLVMSAAVPLYLTAQRQADAAVLRARMLDRAREAAAHLREDIRQARTVEIGRDGRSLRLARSGITGGSATVEYRSADTGLVRTLRTGSSGPLQEEARFETPPLLAHFHREGTVIIADLTANRAFQGRLIAVKLSCVAAPRIAP